MLGHGVSGGVGGSCVRAKLRRLLSLGRHRSRALSRVTEGHEGACGDTCDHV
jgi:hypothetical protein